MNIISGRIICFALIIVLTSCISINDMRCVNNCDRWLERARSHAIDNCVTFFDDVNGDFKMDFADNRMRYTGSLDLNSFMPVLTIEVDRAGRLISMDFDSFVLFPEDALSKGAKRQRCRSYRDYHDQFGRSLGKNWEPYLDWNNGGTKN